MHGLQGFLFPYIFLALVLVMMFGAVYAGNQYAEKSYEFHGMGHKIEVDLNRENVLTVYISGEVLGTRQDFCNVTEAQ